jgi:hypothetical protein
VRKTVKVTAPSSTLVKLEEKEYTDQVVTTTTTVTTLTSDSMFFMCENGVAPYDFHSHSVMDMSGQNGFLSNSSNEHFLASNHKSNGDSSGSHVVEKSVVRPNMPRNIYSCLTNIYSDF